MDPSKGAIDPSRFDDFRRAVRAKIDRDLEREKSEGEARRRLVVPAIRRGLEEARHRGLCGAAWLFGSYAWGEPRERSDVDLLLASCLDPDGVASIVGRLTGTDVHAVAFDDAPQNLRQRVLREGVAL